MIGYEPDELGGILFVICLLFLIAMPYGIFALIYYFSTN